MWISVVFVSGQGANYWTQRAESWSDEKAMKIRWIYPTVYHTVWRETTAIFRTTLNYWWTVQMSFSSSAKNLNLLFYIHTDPIYMVSNGFYWRCLLNRYLSFLNIYYSFWNTWYKKRTFSKKIMQHCWLKHYLTHPVCFSSTQPFSNRNSPVRNILKFGPWRSFFFYLLYLRTNPRCICVGAFPSSYLFFFFPTSFFLSAETQSRNSLTWR